MKIFIMTKGRQKQQLTLNALPAQLQEITWLVAPEGETGYTYPRILYAPASATCAGETRQWIMENAFVEDPKIIMLDDDLNFAERYGNGTKLKKIEDKERLIPYFQLLEQWMDTIPVVGFSPRQGNNTVEDEYRDNTKLTRFLGINRSFVTEERFDRTKVTDDYDFLLWMLRNGKPNRVLYTCAQDQPGSNTVGGASTYRTKEVHEESVRTLAANHPGFVKIVEKEVKKGWFGGKRLDVIISWKKAYASGS